ncbi:MAG TPA: phosphatase PAP2 family protein [Tepidisphaeraceae bacterium]|nr:phosphatase PAP2 family protein [Tepidisphaeraceae bacterium]
MPSPTIRGSSRGRVVAWAVVRGTIQRFTRGWRRLPAGAFRRWVVTIVVGFAACAGLAVLVTRLAQRWHAAGWLQPLDDRGLAWVERHAMSFSNAILCESFGNLAYLIPLTTTAAGWLAWRRRPLAALGVLASYWLERPLYVIGWQLWDRARPATIAEGIAAPGLHSFPSGHAALSAAAYGLLAWLWISRSRSWAERGLVVLLLAALLTVVAIARLRLGTHWPSDVIVGTVLGLCWAAVVATALRRAEAIGGR